jgi:hypothetical protein
MITVAKVRKLALPLILLSLLLGTNATASAQASNSKKAKILLTITTKKAKLSRIAGRKFKLVIYRNNVSSILAFSDRPTRLAFSIKPKNLAKITLLSKELISNDPPNVSLVFDQASIPDAAFEVQSAQVTDKAIRIRLKLLTHAKVPTHYQGKLIVFVDSFWNSLTGHGSAADNPDFDLEPLTEGADAL